MKRAFIDRSDRKRLSRIIRRKWVLPLRLDLDVIRKWGLAIMSLEIKRRLGNTPEIDVIVKNLVFDSRQKRNSMGFVWFEQFLDDFRYFSRSIFSFEVK